jgi:hypothetical protein
VLTLLMLTTLLRVPAQEASPAADITLVVERVSAGGYVYTCNGKVLDPKRVLTGLQSALRADAPGKTRMFVLLGDDVSLDKTFEMASLIEGKIGLTAVRYFAFSRRTGVMQEVKPSWDRWKLSFDGKLEKAPFISQ